MFVKRVKERKVPPPKSNAHSMKDFYQSSLDYSLGIIVGFERAGSKWQGLTDYSTHTEPKQGDHSGENGTVLVLEGDFNECRQALQRDYKNAKEKADKFMDVLGKKESSNDDINQAKTEMDAAQKAAFEQLKTFGNGVNHGQVSRVRVRIQRDDIGHHGTREENWIKLTLKYKTQDGTEKSTTIATFDPAVKIMSEIENASRKAADTERQYRSFMSAVQEYMPQEIGKQ